MPGGVIMYVQLPVPEDDGRDDGVSRATPVATPSISVRYVPCASQPARVTASTHAL